MPDERNPTADAITESDIPDVMSGDEAADLLAGNIEHLLNINISDDDQGDEGQSEDAEEGNDEDGDDQDQRQRAESDDTDDDDTDDDDQGDDDQSDDDSDDDEDSSDASGPLKLDEKFELEMDGEPVETTLEELRDGYMRTRDYTRKTQALATTVADKVEEGIAQARSELNERGQTLDGLVSLFDGMVPKQPSMADLQQKYSDPATAARVFEQQAKLRAQIEKASQEAAKLKTEENQRLVDQQTAVARRTLDIMRETDPRWKSDDGAKREFAKVQRYLGDYSLGEDDLVAILQKPAFLSIVMDAMYGQAVRKAKPKLNKKREKSKTRARQRTTSRQGGKPNGQDRAELRKRVRQGDEQASLAMIESMI